MTDDQRTFLLHEYDRLVGDLMKYYESITATEKLALVGAAAIVAFLYTDLPSFAAGQARILAALPAAIIALGGLRCLSIYLVMVKVSAYLRRIEAQLAPGGLGFQREFHGTAHSRVRLIEATTFLFWLLALGPAVAFWWLYRPGMAGA